MTTTSLPNLYLSTSFYLFPILLLFLSILFLFLLPFCFLSASFENVILSCSMFTSLPIPMLFLSIYVYLSLLFVSVLSLYPFPSSPFILTLTYSPPRADLGRQ